MTNRTVVDALEEIVFGGVAMTAAALHQATDGQELTFTQWRAIVVVGETGDGLRISEVAQRVLATLPATSRLLRRLERRGLMVLEPDPTDGRATRARLTEAGARLRSAVLAYRRERLAEIAAVVDLPAAAEPAFRELALAFERRRP